MAFLRRFPRSPYFFAGFTLPDGRRVQRSTKQSSRRKAQAIADKWEHTSWLGSQQRLSEAQARRVLSDIYEVVNEEPLKSVTAHTFLSGWVESRKIHVSPGTLRAYAQIVRDFVESLGIRANRDISQITKADIAKYHNAVAKRTSISTANKSLKYLRVAFNAAYNDGFSQDNPAERLDTIKRNDADRPRRRPFTLAEIEKILANAHGEWTGIILFGYYTGQRIGDIARTTWKMINQKEAVWRFISSKTRRQMEIPLAPRLTDFLSKLPISDSLEAPIFPSACAIVSKDTSDGRLSQQFHNILVRANLATARSKEATGRGRSQKRQVNEVSFHSFRHTTTSALKLSGASESVAKALIGHASTAASQHYTHVGIGPMRSALEKLPALA